MKKLTTFLAMVITLCFMTATNCSATEMQAAITPKNLDITPIKGNETPYELYERLLFPMKDYMLESFEESGDIVNFCITINPEEFQIEAFWRSDDFSGYQDSVFITGMTASYAKEFYTIMSVEAYEELVNRCEDEAAIFAQLITNPLKSLDYEQISYVLDKLDYPVTIETYLFDGEYFLIKAVVNEYVVRKGDTLFEIAEKFDTTVEQLAEINQIEDPSFIYVDQVLVIY